MDILLGLGMAVALSIPIVWGLNVWAKKKMPFTECRGPDGDCFCPPVCARCFSDGRVCRGRAMEIEHD